MRVGFALAIAAVVAGALSWRARPEAPPAQAAPAASAPKLTRFEDGKSSIDELGRAFVAALAANDREAMVKLTPSYREYAQLLYPEFVKAGEPLLGSMGLQWAWDNLGHASIKDGKRLLDELGGKKLTFESIVTGPDQPRGAVSLYPKVLVRAKDEAGKSVELRGIFAVVAKDGVYKILRYRQNWD